MIGSKAPVGIYSSSYGLSYDRTHRVAVFDFLDLLPREGVK